MMEIYSVYCQTNSVSRKAHLMSCPDCQRDMEVIFRNVYELHKIDNEAMAQNQQMQDSFNELYGQLNEDDDEVDDVAVMQRNILRFSSRFKEALRSGFKVLPKHSRFFDQYMKIIYFYQ